MEKTELKMLISTILVLGFCFSYRNLIVNKTGLSGLILTTLLVALSIAVHEIVHKKIANRYDTEIEFKTWGMLLFTALVLAVLTEGRFIFAALWVVLIRPTRLFRPRHKYPHAGPLESAKIGAAGPMANFVFALLAAIITFRTGSAIWNQLMIMNFWIAGMNLFPFFRLIALFSVGGGKTWHHITKRIGSKLWENKNVPYMEGELIFFGSRMLSMFLLFLVAITAVLVLALEMVFTGLLIGLVFGIGVWIFMEYYTEPSAQKPVPSNLKFWRKL